jgi:hypothetical protein
MRLCGPTNLYHDFGFNGYGLAFYDDDSSIELHDHDHDDDHDDTEPRRADLDYRHLAKFLRQSDRFISTFGYGFDFRYRIHDGRCGNNFGQQWRDGTDKRKSCGRESDGSNSSNCRLSGEFDRKRKLRLDNARSKYRNALYIP